MKGDNIGYGFAGFVIEKAPSLFKGRNGDFSSIFTDFDFGDNSTALIFDCSQLIYTAKYRPFLFGYCRVTFLYDTNDAIDAISVPIPPRFVPMIRCRQSLQKPDSRIVVGTLLMTWLDATATSSGWPPTKDAASE